MTDAKSELSSQFAPKFLTHRNCEAINPSFVKSLSFGTKVTQRQMTNTGHEDEMRYITKLLAQYIVQTKYQISISYLTVKFNKHLKHIILHK